MFEDENEQNDTEKEEDEFGIQDEEGEVHINRDSKPSQALIEQIRLGFKETQDEQVQNRNV